MVRACSFARLLLVSCSRRALRRAAGPGLLMAALSACGRHATKADCELILDRMVIVKLKQKKITDPESISRMQADMRKDAEADFPGCVGRRISDGALDCIKKADTQEDIVKCLR